MTGIKKEDNLYRKMISEREFVKTEEGYLIVYKQPIKDTEVDACIRLIELGYVHRIVVNGERIIELGNVVEVFHKSEDMYGVVMKNRLNRYTKDQQEVVWKALSCFAKIRKQLKISVTKLLEELDFYERFPIPVVINSLEKYIAKEYWKEGKGESYVRGIIKQCNRTYQIEISQSRSSKEFINGVKSINFRKSLDEERRKLCDLMIKIEMKKSKLSYDEISNLSSKTLHEIIKKEKESGEGYWRKTHLISKLESKYSVLYANSDNSEEK